MTIVLNGTSGITTPGIDASGTNKFATTIGVGAATPAASGAGITFPATASASSNANTLDDYEEGTWTPTDGSGAGLTFVAGTSARYTKIGRCVFIDAEIFYPTTSSASTVLINGLPFTSSAGSDYNSGICMNNANLNVWSFVNFNVTSIEMYLQGSTFAAPTNAQFSTKAMYISIWYLTAS